MAALLLSVSSAAGAGATLPAPVVEALRDDGLPQSSLSLLVHAVDEVHPRVAHLVDVPRNPASAMKVVTTWAALNLLGPEFKWTTEVHAAGDSGNGRLEGDVYLKGSGDPFLVTEQLWRLLRTVRRKGIEEIAGDFVVDRTVFDVRASNRGAFDGKPERAYNVEPDGALLNFGGNEVHVERRAGYPRPIVQIEPRLAGFGIENALTFTKRPCRGRLDIRLVVERGASPGIRLEGKFPARCRRFSIRRSIATHDAYARGLIGHLWKAVGGKLGGKVRSGRLHEATRVVASHDSEPLALMGWRLNKFSNNVMARQLLLTIGQHLEGTPGTVEKGRRAVKRWLASQGLDAPALFLDNGAGLSREVRIRADTLGRLLGHAYRSPLRPEFVATFPLAGVDGTLAKRFRDSAVTGRAHLKTGLLNGVRALAGYVHGAAGKHYVVVALQNYPKVHKAAGTRVQNALIEWLVKLPG